MKKQNFSIIFVFIFLFFSGLQIQAQSSIDEKVIDEKVKQDEIEVTKFAESFLDSFIENKDFDKVPTDFFEKDFKTRFVIYGDCFLESLKDQKPSEQDNYEMGISSHNLFNLLAMIVGANSSKEKSQESDEPIISEKYLPSDIVESFRKSKWLGRILRDDSEHYPEPKTIAEMRELSVDMSAVSDKMRIYLQNHPVKNSSNFQKIRKENFKYFPARICEGESCMGLPEKTPIFAVHELMLCLRIAKINDQWKVVQIYSAACED